MTYFVIQHKTQIPRRKFYILDTLRSILTYVFRAHNESFERTFYWLCKIYKIKIKFYNLDTIRSILTYVFRAHNKSFGRTFYWLCKIYKMKENCTIWMLLEGF